MAYTKAYLEKNREIINLKRRQKYCSGSRNVYYRKHRDAILQKSKEDTAMCPICQISYRRLYLSKHLECRHKFGNDRIAELLECPSFPN